MHGESASKLKGSSFSAQLVTRTNTVFFLLQELITSISCWLGMNWKRIIRGQFSRVGPNCPQYKQHTLSQKGGHQHKNLIIRRIMSEKIDLRHCVAFWIGWQTCNQSEVGIGGLWLVENKYGQESAKSIRNWFKLIGQNTLLYEVSKNLW